MTPLVHEGETHPKKAPTQIKARFPQTISGQFVQTVPPFSLKTSRKEAEEFAQIVSGWLKNRTGNRNRRKRFSQNRKQNRNRQNRFPGTETRTGAEKNPFCRGTAGTETGPTRTVSPRKRNRTEPDRGLSGPVRDTPPYRAIPFRDSIAEGVSHPFALFYTRVSRKYR